MKPILSDSELRKFESFVCRAAIVLLVALFSSSAGRIQASPTANIVYVNVANTGKENGTQEHPFRTIKRGLDNVAYGGTVLVYPGTYVENVLLTWQYVNGQGVYGKVALVSIAGPKATIIDGNAMGPAVFVFGAEAVIDGFTIQNGGGSSSLATDGYGVAVQGVPGPRATIRNNVIKNNNLRGGIGIMSSDSNANFMVLVENNMIVENGLSEPEIDTGGILLEVPYGNRVTGSITIQNNVIAFNHGFYRGGIALRGWDTVAVDVINNTVFGNDNEIHGGGIVAAIGNLRLINNIFFGNVAHQEETNDLYLGGAGESALLLNNDIGQGSPISWTNGNISAPPLFLDPVNHNWHLRVDSPCIDTGTTTGAPAHDIEGNPRPSGAGVDMGAYEYIRPADDLPPTSRAASPSVSGVVSFTVRWSGADPGIAGLAYYDLQYKDGTPGTWTDWITHTSALSATFVGQIGHTFYFQSRAVDQAGNVESYPGGEGDTFTFVGPDLTSSTKESYAQDEEPTNGSVVTYTIFLRNLGPAPAMVNLTDTLPASTAYISPSLTATTGAAVFDPGSGDRGTIRWNGAVSVHVPVNISFQVELSSSTSLTLPIHNIVFFDDGFGHVYQRVAFVPSHKIYLPLMMKSP